MPSQLSDYKILEPISNGPFGNVYLALYKTKYVALKSSKLQTKNEILIHRNMKHEHIIRLYDAFIADDSVQYMAIEYAAGGELFDKILPDVGVDEELAQFYFCQLISGVEFLHCEGVCHRDLKPENILLDEEGNLKICDFGLSTVFRNNHGKRRLTTICGTRPYIAPEILFEDYDGEAIDIWSCGIILFVLLCGNTPWDEPTENSPEFCFYCTASNVHEMDPWSRMNSSVYELVRGMCNIYEENRVNISMIKNHPWFTKKNTISRKGKGEYAAITRLLGQLNIDQVDVFASQMDILSQHQPQGNAISFSQPIESIGTYGYGNHISLSQPDRQITSVPSLTRFYAKGKARVMIERIAKIMDEFLVSYKTSETSIHFNTVDKRKCIMTGEIVIKPTCNQLLLVNFKRTKGDPLEFKRFYNAIRGELDEFICKDFEE